MTVRVGVVVLAAAVVVLAGCGSDGEGESARTIPEGPPPACNPVAAELDCLAPYPSNVFLVRDATTRSGARVEIPATALPKDITGRPFDVSRLYGADGFPIGTQVFALLGEAIDPGNLPTYDPQRPELLERSLARNSPTVLLDTVTGQRVLHLAEPDPRATSGRRQALLVRPLVRLTPGRRYIVALRDLRSPTGVLLPSPDGFRQIRDRQVVAPELVPWAQRYEREIFPVLEAAGIPRASLQLAWDFTVRTEEDATADLLAIRNDALERLRRDPPRVTITSVAPSRRPEIARRIEGTLEVPLYLESTRPGARIHRDPTSGRPALKGRTTVPFLALVPHSVEAGREPVRLLQFGHGFFGSVGEMEGGYLPQFLQDYHWVAIGTEWWGMSQADLTTVAADLLNDPSLAIRFTDRVHQAMVNFMALAAARFRLAEEPALRREDGQALFDPQRLYFIGLSQGHILGTTYTALSPDIERAVLAVGGADFTFIMFRSRAFGLFLGIIAGMFPDPLDQQKITILLQSIFDRLDPLTYSAHVVRDPYPGAPAKRVLLHMGTGDAEVPNLATELHARALGIPLAVPSAVRIPGLGTAPYPIDGSALAVYAYAVDPFPGILAIPPNDPNEVHEGQRELPAAQMQVDAFLRPNGKIESFCDGVCDPE